MNRRQQQRFAKASYELRRELRKGNGQWRARHVICRGALHVQAFAANWNVSVEVGYVRDTWMVTLKFSQGSRRSNGRADKHLASALRRLGYVDRLLSRTDQGSWRRPLSSVRAVWAELKCLAQLERELAQPRRRRRPNPLPPPAPYRLPRLTAKMERLLSLLEKSPDVIVKPTIVMFVRLPRKRRSGWLFQTDLSAVEGKWASWITFWHQKRSMPYARRLVRSPSLALATENLKGHGYEGIWDVPPWGSVFGTFSKEPLRTLAAVRRERRALDGFTIVPSPPRMAPALSWE